jgi:Rha family phage regulatory protein
MPMGNLLWGRVAWTPVCAHKSGDKGRFLMKKDWVVLNADKHPVTTSRTVSEVFGKLHEMIVAKIEMLDFSSEFFRQNFNIVRSFNNSWCSNQNYEMTRDGFIFLSIGFTGKKACEFSLAYLEAFDDVLNV